MRPQYDQLGIAQRLGGGAGVDTCFDDFTMTIPGRVYGLV